MMRFVGRPAKGSIFKSDDIFIETEHVRRVSEKYIESIVRPSTIGFLGAEIPGQRQGKKKGGFLVFLKLFGKNIL